MNRRRKIISIMYDIPVCESCLYSDEIKLDGLINLPDEILKTFCLETNCFEFLNSKYLFDNNVDKIMVIHRTHFLEFILNKETNRVECRNNNKLVHGNIREVNNIRKMYFGGMFDNVEDKL